MRVVHPGAALLLFALAGGCGYPDVGFSDDAAAAEDAAQDGSPADGPSEGSVTDAPRPPDTGLPPPIDSEPPPIDTGPPTFCMTGAPHAFCADFDAVKTYADGWDATDTADGSLALDLSSSASAPRSLLAKLTTTSAGAVARLRVVRTPTSSTSTVRLEFQANLEAWSGGGTGPQMLIARIMRTGPDPGASPWVAIGVGTSGISVRHAPNLSTTPSSELTGKSVSVGKWAQFRLDVKFSDNTASPATSIALTMDGVPMWSGNANIGVVDPKLLDTELAVGLSRFASAPPYTASYDNVTLDFL